MEGGRHLLKIKGLFTLTVERLHGRLCGRLLYLLLNKNRNCPHRTGNLGKEPIFNRRSSERTGSFFFKNTISRAVYNNGISKVHGMSTSLWNWSSTHFQAPVPASLTTDALSEWNTDADTSVTV